MGVAFGMIGRTEAAKGYVNVQNVSATSISAHIPLELDVVAPDGVRVTAAKSGSLAALWMGINDQALADSDYGIAQVYGYRASAYVSRASAGDTPGAFLRPTAGIFDSGTTLSAATTSGHTFVTLLDTITASAAYSSAAQIYTHAVFIRF